MPLSPITITTTVNASPSQAWNAWVSPEHIQNWNHASDDWECPNATNDLRIGGRFSSTMRAKDQSASFDFQGTYTALETERLIEYVMDDGRKVSVTFESTDDGVRITESFDPETENPPELQRDGWQSILNNFKAYV